MPEQEHDVAAAVRAASRRLATLRRGGDLDATLSEIVRAAVETVAPADAAGISLAEDGVITSRGPSVASVGALDRLQAQWHEGPCITAIDEPPGDGTVLADDLAGPDADRWPRFAPAAVRAGYRSLLSVELVAGDGLRGALNLYAAEPHVFDGDAREVAGLFGVRAATLLGDEWTDALAQTAETSDLIGQAKGILMERHTVDDEAAARMLAASSQEAGTTVVDAAQWLRGRARHRHAESVALPDRDPHETADERDQLEAERAPWGHGTDGT